MTNILQDGVTWLGGQLKDHCGLSVTYARGAVSVAITATATMHEYQVFTTEGFETQVVARDYLVHAADLVISGSLITPRAGDRITETIAGTDTVFEVVPLSDQMPAYVQTDSYGTLLTIHTKKVG